ncbi:MAG TPA: hypothetical protein VH641_09395, partial [Streptosporangiaceae bacterium]
RLQLLPPGRTRLIGRAATATIMVATVVFAAVGPLQAGWARRAGTPSMLGSVHAAAAHVAQGRSATTSEGAA